ncbi:putative cytochrome P450 E-class, group IV [Rhypophila decipiens]|uniref:Cytochrome P450 E-class, group IV n=1 Tax=Rhypophila decipiens TaxID=261697 RepID=A0AAN6Y3I2_9PEZI|nr:putative cytochrome P450 E-class, group IV [Rhypophila decipiens]
MAISEVIVERLPLVLSTSVVFLAVYLFKIFLTPDPLANLPIIGEDLGGDEKRRQQFRLNAKATYNEGYKKFRDGLFRIITTRNSQVVVVSPDFLDELKRLPDDMLSFSAAAMEGMHSKYTQLRDEPLLPHTIKTSLTPGLVRLNPTVADEVQDAIRLEMPPCDDWTPVRINQKLLRVVAMASGRILVGPELCRSEEYLESAIKYTIELMEARSAVDAIPPWIRPFKASRLPQVKQLDQRIKKATAFMQPIVEARLALNRADVKPDDMLQWMIDDQMKEQHGKLDIERQARLQLSVSFVSIHTTTLTATNVFYNLAAFPEHNEELRQEIRTVLAEHGGVFSSTALQAMKKVDSFLKESMRFHTPGVSSFQRKVLKPFTLSNGQHIPAGIIIEVPAQAIAMDPEMFEEPDKFDGLRFYKMREKAREAGEFDVAGQGQFVSVSKGSLSFGYGRHACPGRFFAGNEIKMIVANYLLNYDIKLADGYTERYPNIEMGGTSVPDPTKELLFKRIST